MNVLIDPIKISALEKKPNFLHGFSPRHFEIPGKGKEVLRLGRTGDLDSSPEHLNGFLRSLNIMASEVFLVRQVHGNEVYTLEDRSVTTPQTACVEADAIITHLRGKAVGVLTADCIPIIVYDPHLHVVGVVHAGRRGSAKNILSNTVTALGNRYGCKPETLLVGMGPGIGVCCYEVEEPCIQPFRKNYSNWERFVKLLPGNKFMLDLFQANREDSLSAGVLEENIFLSGQCTSCENHRFFSYRKEGKTGRMMALAMLTV